MGTVHRYYLARSILVALVIAVLAGKWDIWWHVAVGRDTFFEPPHLFLYAGVFIAILLSWYGWWRWRNAAWKFLALILLLVPLSAPLDEWWHRMFGIEVLTSPFVVWSPPHLLLIVGLAASVLMLQPIFREDPDLIARRFFLALAVAAMFSVLFVLVIPLEPLGAYKVLGFWGTGFAAFLSVLLFFLAERWVGGVGAVSFVVLFFLVFQSVGVREKVADGIVIASHARPPHWIYIFSYLAPALFMDLFWRGPGWVRGGIAGMLYGAIYYGVVGTFLDPAFQYGVPEFCRTLLAAVMGGITAFFVFGGRSWR